MGVVGLLPCLLQGLNLQRSQAFWLARPELPAFTDDLDRESLRQALQRSLDYARRLQPDRMLPFGERQITSTTLIQTLEAFQQVVAMASTPAALQQALRERFDVLQSPGRDAHGEVLFTGYYEIELEGSFAPSARFPYPLYKRPPDLIDAETDTVRAADRRGPSGRAGATRASEARIIPVVKSMVRAGYEGEGSNSSGCAALWMVFSCMCRALARYVFQMARCNGCITRHRMATRTTASAGALLDEGRLPREAMSLQGLRRYFRDHPEETTRILYRNPRYIFFRPVDHGPQGNLGLILVPGRSIATDQRLFPPGGLAFVQLQQPVLNAQGEITAWRPASRFVFNHDTGSAITGPGRIDLFWGSGPQAEMAAGHMQHTGKVFFLLKRAP